MLERCVFISNVVTANSSYGNVGIDYGGAAYGGAVQVRSSVAVVNESLFASNSTVARWAGGGALELSGSAVRMTNTAFVGNAIWSFWGTTNAPGIAQGGAVAGGQTLTFVNCTFANNQVYANPPAGSANGGALSCVGTALLAHVTLANNSPSGIEATNAVLMLRNSIVANSAGANYRGGLLVDDGNNFSSDDSCPFTAPGSRSNTDPRLGSLGNYGGMSPTIPLLAGSPAIDAGAEQWCPLIDQRGFPRTLGGHCDAGAFEVPPAFLFTSITPSETDLRVRGMGIPSRSFRFQASVSLTNWQDIRTDVASPEGMFEIRIPNASLNQKSFYRTAAP
jgi:hypothetical protein